MELIVFAHRGEAQVFLKELELNPHPLLTGLYQGESLLLLIAGEGIYDVMSKLPFVFASFDITRVVNLGIAGALSDKCQLDEIYEVRTCYGFQETSPRFHSFTTFNQSAKIDCITTDQRVLTDEQAHKLSHFAAMVDRELWGLAYCCQSYKRPLYAYKLISDRAGNQTQCLDVKERAQHYSQKLFHFYQSFNNQLENTIKDEFHPPVAMSFSHSKLYQKLMENLCGRENKTEAEILQSINFQEILTADKRSKDKAQEIIHRLTLLKNPLKAKITESLEKQFLPFTRIGAKIHVDPKLEHKTLKLTFEINHQQNLERLKKACEEFDFRKIEKIWQGDLDV
jgi:hypothetical protein